MSAPMLAGPAALLGALILVGSALVRQQLGRRRLLRLALAWAGIILVVWGVANLGLALRRP